MIQPLLVSTSAIQLASETVRSIMKIDDIVSILVKVAFTERMLSMFLHPSIKGMQHKFDWLYFFNHGFIFVMLNITGKLVYLPFYWCLTCYDCFAGACVGLINWGQCQKCKVAKFDRTARRWYFMLCVRLVMRSCLTKISRNKTCWILYWCNFATFNFWDCP